jgi:hypothetical protein
VLVGVGAVIVAALVLVALFRPDGPLDPPLDPTADGIYQTAVPVATVPPVVVPAPRSDVRTEIDADAPQRVAVRPASDLPADTRPSVTTTPPSLPKPSDVSRDTPSRAGHVRAEAPPTGVTPTPAAPFL